MDLTGKPAQTPSQDIEIDPNDFLVKDRGELSEGLQAELTKLEASELIDTTTMTPEEVVEALRRMRQGEEEYLERQTENSNEQIAARAEFVLGIKTELHDLLEEVAEDVEQGHTQQAEAKIKKYLAKVRKDLEASDVSGEDIDAALSQLDHLIDLDLELEQIDDRKKKIGLTLLSVGIDAVPLVGGAKMGVEAVAGKTLDGEKLKGRKRLAHMGEAVFWEIVDIAAIAAALGTFGTGGAAVEALKLAKLADSAGDLKKAGKAVKVVKAAKFGVEKAPQIDETMKRAGATMQKEGMTAGAKELFSNGKGMEKHPELLAAAQRGFDATFERRFTHLVEAAEDELEAQIAVLQAINEERIEFDETLDRIAIRQFGSYDALESGNPPEGSDMSNAA